jgi:hypothetical protein
MCARIKIHSFNSLDPLIVVANSMYTYVQNVYHDETRLRKNVKPYE